MYEITCSLLPVYTKGARTMRTKKVWRHVLDLMSTLLRELPAGERMLQSEHQSRQQECQDALWSARPGVRHDLKQDGTPHASIVNSTQLLLSSGEVHPRGTHTASI